MPKNFLEKNKFAIIGNPVSHSLSPAMHNAAFAYRHLPYHYRAILLKKKELPSFFSKLRNSPYLGLNVTVPYKEEVLGYLDRLDPFAQSIGAVNTIHNQEGKLWGYNTDAAGYLKALQVETGLFPRDKKIVLLGAGGAARAILAALCQAKAKEIVVVNRTLQKAKRLVQEFSKKFKKVKLCCSPWQAEALKKNFTNTHLLVNASSLGLHDAVLPPLPLDGLPRGAWVSDIVYSKQETPLINISKNNGFKTQSGLGMLLYQGALAFEIWTHQKAPIRVMKKALLKGLQKR